MIIRNLFLFGLMTLFFTGCQTPRGSQVMMDATPEVPALTSHFHREIPLAEVNDAVLRSLRSRGWRVTSTTPEAIEAMLIHRSYESGIRITMTPRSISIYSDSWRIDRQGNRVRRDHPDGWFRNIEHDVRRFLFLPH